MGSGLRAIWQPSWPQLIECVHQQRGEAAVGLEMVALHITGWG